MGEIMSKDEENYYEPCRTGIHLCGSNAADDAPITLANYPMPLDQAREALAKIRAECQEPDGEFDVVVDLVVDDDILEGVTVRRQMLNRVAVICGATA